MSKPTGYGKPGDVDQHVAQAQARKAPSLTPSEAFAVLKTAQLWAMLRNHSTNSNVVYWAKCELRKRGYCV